MLTDTLRPAHTDPVAPVSSLDHLTALVDAFPATFQLAVTGFVAGTMSWSELLREINDGYSSCSLVPADLRFLAGELMSAVEEYPVTSVVVGARLLSRGRTQRRRFAHWRRQMPLHRRGVAVLRA